MNTPYDKRMQELAAKWLDKTISPEEENEFFDWYNSRFKEETEIPLQYATSEVELEQRLKKRIDREIKPQTFPVKKWLVAASVLLVLTLGALYYINSPAKDTVQPLAAYTDVKAPASVNAILTMSDGRTIVLDSAANGVLAMSGATSINKTGEGELSYSGGTASTVLQYNTLQVPRGSKPVHITLSDGSQVWLNASSSLKYPVYFSGNNRPVEITGEAYFEVTTNAAKPFIVKKQDMQVQVLGTHFNINTYTDEPAARVTLLEGKVNVIAGADQQLLKPGEQAVVNNKISLNRNADIKQAVAWKEGRFDFGERTDLKTIMRQLSRWYNVEVEYRGSIDQYFFGRISRQVNISKVLRNLEMTGAVHFKIEGNKIIVTP